MTPPTHLYTASPLAAIVESSDDAIVSKDLNGIIQSWNRGAERILGYTAEEAIGRPVAMLIPPEHADEEPEVLRRVRNGDRIDHYESVRERKDGQRIYVSLTVSPIRDAEGRIVGASKIARDITERDGGRTRARGVTRPRAGGAVRSRGGTGPRTSSWPCSRMSCATPSGQS